jgi:hypothetical protein
MDCLSAVNMERASFSRDQPAVKIRFQMRWVSIENLLGVKAGGMHFSCVLAGVPPENDNQNNYTQQGGQKLHQPQVNPQALTNH